MNRVFWLCAAFFICAAHSLAREVPTPTEADFVLKDFRFAAGETLPQVRMHYRTLGTLRRDDKGVAQNAVLIMHGTTGSGANFFREEFAGQLFNKGQLLDSERYFIIVPDALGHGKSSKPRDGLHAKFPRYGYRDMIEADYRLLTEGLKVNHLRLVMGTSMGGMHTWLWGELHPDFMNALMPLASLPAEISGRNRVWRQIISDAIRNDPQWNGGDYTTQPQSLRTAAEILYFVGSNPVLRYKEAPTGAKAQELLEAAVADAMKTKDANDVLYAVESSRDYNPGPALESISAPLVAINFGDDLINPPELGILEREIKRVKRGTAILIPMSEKTRGHGTHTIAEVWKDHLKALLESTEK